MNRLFLAFGTLLVSALLVPGDADARRFGGGGGGARVGGGGFRGGGFTGARMMRPPVRAGIGRSGRGFAGGAIGVRSGMGGYRPVGIGNPGGRYDGRYYGRRYPNYGGRYYGGRYPNYAGRYPYYGGYRRYPYYGGYYGNYYNGWGWGAGLAAGSVIGAAAASTYPAYSTPVSSTVGGYCATTVRTCALSSSAPVGTGCSCRTQGGRARGTVVAGF
jgi:hypothetical protein